MSAVPEADAAEASRSLGAAPAPDGGYLSDVRLPIVMAVGILIVVVAVAAIRLASGGGSVDEEKPRVLVLGDSITNHGQRPLRDTIGPVYALSIEGQDNFRIDQQVPVAERWATRPFEQVVINLGTNDVVQGWPVDQSAASLQRLVDLFTTARCIHLVTVNESLPGRTAGTAEHAAELNERIREIAASDPRARVVDWNAIVVEQEAQGVKVTSDGVHPTEDGQQLLVGAYEASINACSAE